MNEGEEVDQAQGQPGILRGSIAQLLALSINNQSWFDTNTSTLQNAVECSYR